MVKRAKKTIQFHVVEGDYFGTLATVLDLIAQKLSREDYKQQGIAILEQLRDELVYLQEGYKIIRRREK